MIVDRNTDEREFVIVSVCQGRSWKRKEKSGRDDQLHHTERRRHEQWGQRHGCHLVPRDQHRVGQKETRLVFLWTRIRQVASCSMSTWRMVRKVLVILRHHGERLFLTWRRTGGIERKRKPRRGWPCQSHYLSMLSSCFIDYIVIVYISMYLARILIIIVILYYVRLLCTLGLHDLCYVWNTVSVSVDLVLFTALRSGI